MASVVAARLDRLAVAGEASLWPRLQAIGQPLETGHFTVDAIIFDKQPSVGDTFVMTARLGFARRQPYCHQSVERCR